MLGRRRARASCSSSSEVHRFANGPVRAARRRCAGTSLRPVAARSSSACARARGDGRGGAALSIGIDSWAVDYGLARRATARCSAPVPLPRRPHRRRGVERCPRARAAPTSCTPSTACSSCRSTPLPARRRSGAAALDAPTRMLLHPRPARLTGSPASRGAERTNASTTGLLDATHRRVVDGRCSTRLGLRAGLLPPLRRARARSSGRCCSTSCARRPASTPSTVGDRRRLARHRLAPSSPCPATGRSCRLHLLRHLGARRRRARRTRCSPTTAARPTSPTRAASTARVRYLRNVMGLWLLSETLRTWEPAGPRRRPAVARSPRPRPLPAGGPVVDVDDPALHAARRHARPHRRAVPRDGPAGAAGQPARWSAASSRASRAAFARAVDDAERLSGRGSTSSTSSAAARATAAVPAHRRRLPAARCSPGRSRRPRSATCSSRPARTATSRGGLDDLRALVRRAPRRPRPLTTRATERRSRADRAVRHLPRRRDVPVVGPGDGAPARAARPRGRRPAGAGLLRPDARQHRLPEATRCRVVATPRRGVRGGYDVVVAPSGSCVGSVRHQHAMVAEPAATTALARRCRAPSPRAPTSSPSCWSTCSASTDVGAWYPHRVTYHPTCHSLRLLRVGDRPLTLLRNVRGPRPGRAARRAETCCGFGGTFALKNSAVSGAMLADKVRDVVATGARSCTAGDSSCLHAHRRRAVPAARRRAGRAPGRDPRRRRGPSRGRAHDRAGRSSGMPTRRAASATCAATSPFPHAARARARRTPSCGATSATRRRRSGPSGCRAVGEVPDWEELRAGGRGDQGRRAGAPRPS